MYIPEHETEPGFDEEGSNDDDEEGGLRSLGSSLYSLEAMAGSVGSTGTHERAVGSRDGADGRRRGNEFAVRRRVGDGMW